MKKLSIAALALSALTLVGLSLAGSSEAASTVSHTPSVEVENYAEPTPVDFTDLEESVSVIEVPEVVIVSHPPVRVQEKKNWECGSWREMANGSRVKDCEWR